MKEAHNHHRVSPQGQTMGVMMARLADAECASLAQQDEPDERCKTCAFRAGTVPNGCAQTQFDVYKAVAENVPFGCHQERGSICHGWFAVRRTADRAAAEGVLLAPATYDFSPPDEPKAAPPIGAQE